MKKSKGSKTDRILIAGLTGTSFMTMFSYLVSETKDENFKEPQLLGMLMHALVPQLKKELTQVAGWNLHYLVGFIFSFLYTEIWERTKIKPTLKSGIILGAISGLIGLTVWRLCFKAHPYPPKINFKRFYGHLLAAHVIFGVFTLSGYRLSNIITSKSQ